jgi:hypothetical protein
METPVKSLIIAAAATAALAASAGTALAQYGDAVPITRNYRGELACPSNYVIRGNACVSIYAGRGGYDDDRGHRRARRHRDFDDSYGRGRAVQPRVNYRGELQCPSNYVIHGGACVSIY